MSHHHQLVAALRQRGVRLTPQREMILDAIHHEDEHLTADEIYRRVCTRSPAVNRATVYRTLELLSALHIINEIHLGDCVRYELRQDRPHHHLVCQTCGRTVSIDHAAFAPLERKLKQRFGFLPRLDHLIIYGQCAKCQRQATSNK